MVEEDFSTMIYENSFFLLYLNTQLSRTNCGSENGNEKNCYQNTRNFFQKVAYLHTMPILFTASPFETFHHTVQIVFRNKNTAATITMTHRRISTPLRYQRHRWFTPCLQRKRAASMIFTAFTRRGSIMYARSLSLERRHAYGRIVINKFPV